MDPQDNDFQFFDCYWDITNGRWVRLGVKLYNGGAFVFIKFYRYGDMGWNRENAVNMSLIEFEKMQELLPEIMDNVP